MKHLADALLQGRLLALPTNIRLGWQYLPGTNILTKVRKLRTKSFIILGPRLLEGWVETNPSNIRISPMDICIQPLSQYHQAIKTDVCIRMFTDVRWVDFHPLFPEQITFLNEPRYARDVGFVEGEGGGDGGLGLGQRYSGMSSFQGSAVVGSVSVECTSL